MNANAAPPMDAAGFARAWRDLGAPARVLLAVSGGADSMALAHLASAVVASGAGPLFAVATVDHGLRAASADEARMVAAWCAGLGLSHQTLRWEGAKPIAGIQERARAARYFLLAHAAEAGGFDAVMTAHTGDDQAETVLMRLKRGAGPRGLAAMGAPLSIAAAASAPVALLRPLLGETRASPRAVLAGAPFIDDPSNDDTRFERVRARAALASLGEKGLLDAAALRATAARAGEAMRRLDLWIASRFSGAGGVFLSWGGVRFEVARLDPDVDGPLLARAIFAVSGADHPPDEAAAETALVAALRTGKSSLGGALISVAKGDLYVFREPAAALGRAGEAAPVIAVIDVAPGARALWDNRFIIANNGDRPQRIECFGRRAPSALYSGPPDGLAATPVASGGDRRNRLHLHSLATERFDGRVIRFPVPVINL